ncbi:hypothetical protein MGYG_05223 [Nannizzia gypsea CBS 118893]|uniref:Uncharacterized protein n=1 Tax=Arthroderma gypseum (strain ATCC MYA-4604 / CBS 118893) TaxID=535722 RepID=E4UV93_ARTGP|nr:hypothetical protein MGYG_05223 [Nannizzia gypsea CBS 118893]EFR02220.1 hypothetical protein MGYG_05223 [Nannizzia gypsea CBS 118893]
MSDNLGCSGIYGKLLEQQYVTLQPRFHQLLPIEILEDICSFRADLCRDPWTNTLCDFIWTALPICKANPRHWRRISPAQLLQASPALDEGCDSIPKFVLLSASKGCML